MISGSVHIIYEERWGLKHLRSLATAYGKAPYFEHYFHEIEALLSKPYEKLFDLNLATIRWAEKVLGLENTAQVYSENTQLDLLAYHSKIHPKKTDTTQSSQFAQYFQCFDWAGFAPNLSVLDLVLNEGPAARTLLKKI